MKIVFIISGHPRNFINKLHNYFIRLNTLQLIEFDVFVNFTKNQDKYYFNTHNNFDILSKYNFYKVIQFTDNIQNTLDEKDNNIINQWYKIKNTFNLITPIYNLYIRIRPDVDFLIEPEEFIKQIKNMTKNNIYIPYGFNFLDGISVLSDNCINDQIAIGNYDVMNKYCNFYDYLVKESRPYRSEELLLKYLNYNSISTIKCIIPYKLILSDCKIISICGDSGSGKSTLLDAIKDIFLFDSSLVLETDRYHKWERSSENWNNYTHLHPDANNLQKMSEDVFRLKIGEDIFAIDYDHSNGKFTSETKISSKPIILLCGLHTIYDKHIRDLSELKIFIDTDSLLKNEWKINRDITKRSHTLEKILANIEKRKDDYKLYIEPQKLYSDIIVEYKYEEKFKLILHVNIIYNYYINLFLSQISTNINTTTYKSYNSYDISENINNNIFNIFIKDNIIISKLKEFPFNVIQTVVYLSLYNDI